MKRSEKDLCGVENLEHRLKNILRLRWFGHVKCRDKSYSTILRRVMELEVEGGRPLL